MSYEVILPKSAQKELDRLPGKIAKRILDALTVLKAQPRPPGCK
jgi:mRNA interferase RelE/StbE